VIQDVAYRNSKVQKGGKKVSAYKLHTHFVFHVKSSLGAYKLSIRVVMQDVAYKNNKVQKAGKRLVPINSAYTFCLSCKKLLKN